MGINLSQVLLRPHERKLSPNDPRRLDSRDRAAIERIAERIEWGGSPQAWREILNHARQEQRSPRSVRQDIVVEGVALALTHMREAQKFKVKTTWIVGDDGKIIEIVPYHLTPPYFEIWLHQEARKATEAVALGRPYPATNDVFDLLEGIDRAGTGTYAKSRRYQELYQHAAPLADYNGESLRPADAEDVDDRREVAQRRLATISEQLTPKERDLIASLEREESRRERAERTGEKVATIRQRDKRLRDHVADIVEAQKREADRGFERCESHEHAAHRRAREERELAQEAQHRGAWEDVRDHEERAWNALHDGYMWRDRADAALADMSPYEQRSAISRRFPREEAWDPRDQMADGSRRVSRSSWQDRLAVQEEAQDQHVRWNRDKRAWAKQRDASTARDVARRARAAWDVASARDAGFAYRVEAALSRAAMRGTEARRAYRLMEAVDDAHAAEEIRRKAVSYGANRDDRRGMPSHSAWPDNRFRRCVREAWEDAWQDAWWGDIGDDDLPAVLGDEYEHVGRIGEQERMSRSLAS